jgi:YHS domain-containing protein
MTQYNVRGLLFVLRRSAWLAVLCTTVALSLAMPDGAHAADAAAAPAQAQFGGQCTEALAEGRHVMTTCTSTWTDKDGKTYCFSNDGAKKSFLESPVENLQRARGFIAASSVESTERPCRISPAPMRRPWSKN